MVKTPPKIDSMTDIGLTFLCRAKLCQHISLSMQFFVSRLFVSTFLRPCKCLSAFLRPRIYSSSHFFVRTFLRPDTKKCETNKRETKKCVDEDLRTKKCWRIFAKRRNAGRRFVRIPSSHLDLFFESSIFCSMPPSLANWNPDPNQDAETGCSQILSPKWDNCTGRSPFPIFFQSLPQDFSILSQFPPISVIAALTRSRRNMPFSDWEIHLPVTATKQHQSKHKKTIVKILTPDSIFLDHNSLQFTLRNDHQTTVNKSQSPPTCWATA